MADTITTTQIALINEESIQSLNAKLSRLEELLTHSQEERFKETWLTSEQARKMLGVCSKTWQTYRDKKVIPFAQFGAKIYVKLSDINTFLESNIVKSA